MKRALLVLVVGVAGGCNNRTIVATYEPDAAGGGAAGSDSGGGAAGGAGQGGAACGGHVSVIDPQGGSGATLVELAGRPRLIYSRAVSGRGYQVFYVECLSGCDTPAPLFSRPLGIGRADSLSRVPVVAVEGGGLFAAWVNNNGLTILYAQCVSDCDLGPSWSFVDYAWSGGIFGVDLDVQGGLHAIASGGMPARWSECWSGCNDSRGNWSEYPMLAPRGPGIAIDLADPLDGGEAWRSIAGGSPANRIAFRECVGTCDKPDASWGITFLDGDGGANPVMVKTPTGLPRLAYTISAAGTEDIVLASCSARPCVRPTNWSYAVVRRNFLEDAGAVPRLEGFTVGSAADDRVFAMGTIDGVVHTAFESDSGFAFSALGCLAGDSPSGYLGPGNRWRIAFASDAGLALYFEPP